MKLVSRSMGVTLPYLIYVFPDPNTLVLFRGHRSSVQCTTLPIGELRLPWVLLLPRVLQAPRSILCDNKNAS